MNPTDGVKGNDYNDMGGVYYDLSYLGDLFECPVVTASQPQRHAWFLPIVELEHMADSSKKAHIAYSVLTLNQLRKEAEEGKFRIYTAKVRRGYTGKMIYCSFDKGKVQIAPAEQWDYMEYI
jgi:hypothetical protein